MKMGERRIRNKTEEECIYNPINNERCSVCSSVVWLKEEENI